MEKFIYYNNLFLIYKDFIKESNQEVFDLYYGDNLSMQEIADLKNLSRSRIGAVIKETEKRLDYLENNCNLYKIKNRLQELLNVKDITEIKKGIKEIIGE